jgi:hypothetical protein
MNNIQTLTQQLLKEASLFAGMIGTSPIEIKVSLHKDSVKELLEESDDFILKPTYLSENELEIDAMLSKIIITIWS